MWGRALIRLGGVISYQTLLNYEYAYDWIGRQTAGDKIRSLEEKSPDWQLRSLNHR
jgi:hypothetical protein